MINQITTQSELRFTFWDHAESLGWNVQRGKRGMTQNDYNADTRQHWCDFIGYMQRDGVISDALAQRATLAYD